MSNINIEMKILDENYMKVGFWKFPGKDAEKFLKLIAKKYGLNIKVKAKKTDKDLDWIK